MLRTEMNEMKAMLISIQDNRSTSTGNDSHGGGDQSRGGGFHGRSGGGRGGRGRSGRDSGRGAGRGGGDGRGDDYNRNPGTFRKYNKYCPNRGVNLQCNGGINCRCNPKTTNTEATYESILPDRS